MSKSLTAIILAVLMIVAVSCEKKSEVTLGQNGLCYYTSFDSAKVAAAETGKNMVLDFYTDW